MLHCDVGLDPLDLTDSTVEQEGPNLDQGHMIHLQPIANVDSLSVSQAKNRRLPGPGGMGP
jgi:hypothetical protein